MLPSHTVENYLKAIYQAQNAIDTDALVPMGQLASALGVVPGTATTMVKALSESGLVKYEPYAGVRLTAAGEKLAAMVLRRHRLIELFLVKVMGMSWTEVHDEAEQLEHAVSDRLIDRIDEMLGRPAVDPHGDPIPDPEGTVHRPAYETLLTCPLHEPMTVSRVSDQDSAFLTFIERQDLKPGQIVEVEERDPAADSVRLRARDRREITIGTRAASKVLVQAAQAIGLVCVLAAAAFAQTPAPPASTAPRPAAEPFQIMDNSFLVEEAFNQEDGIFQNIFGAMRVGGAWAGTFTQEWPIVSQKHQLSYTLTMLETGPHAGFGDALINYRYQLWMEGPRRPAFSPRVSLILPTGDDRKGLGAGSGGLQFNLPFSKQSGHWHWHWNAGMTWLRSVEGVFDDIVWKEDTVSPFLAGSGIYRLRPMVHVMMESVLLSSETGSPYDNKRDTLFTLSPGLRAGWNLGDHQLVLGAAVPVTWTRSFGSTARDTGSLLYLSYELPFKR
jgi:DtxR family Mn-dependent transcriptional regulator